MENQVPTKESSTQKDLSEEDSVSKLDLQRKEAAHERRKQRAREYYWKNRDKIRAQQRKIYATQDKAKYAAKARKYRQENKEKMAALFKEYRAKNKEKFKAYSKKSYEKNREKRREKARAYWKENRDVLLARKREYYEKNKYSICNYSLHYDSLRSIEQIGASCPDEVNNYLKLYPFEEYAELAIKKTLRINGIYSFHDMHDDCYEAGMLKGCSVRFIQKQVKQGQLEYECGKAVNGRPQYLVPLTALDIDLQQKWYRRNGVAPPPELKLVKNDAPPKAVKSLEMYTEQQREQIGYWISLLEKWQTFRDEFQGSKANADAAFIKQEQLDISPATLYRRLAAHKSNDMDGLVELRGQWRKGQSDMNNEVWRVFLSYYLDQANDPIQKCIRSTQDYLDIRNPDLLDNFPSDSAFYWRINQDIPPAITTYNRKGPKALHDRYAPYIRRLYDSMMSNDYWVADNHTFDFMTIGDNGRPHRLYLTAILDARSTAMVGWQVTHAPCGDATLCALRKAIQPPNGKRMNGIPYNFYVDNGSEFLVHDIGGRGHRRTKKQREQQEFEPPPILKRLNINMVNAIPGNPEAKIIERIFRDVKDMLSRSIETFCGGNIFERPERLNKILKSDKVPSDKEVIEAVDEWVEGYYNHLPYGGPIKKDHGKTKIQVYYENLNKIRVPVSNDDLNLMMMRSSRPVKVGRRGVKLEIAGYRIDYWTDEFLLNWQDKKVYFRYDPDDLSSVRVYNDEDKFICTLPADDMAVLEYGATMDKIKEGMRKIQKYNKVVKEWTDGKILDKDEKISVFTLMQIRAKQNIQNPPEYMDHEPKVIEFVRADEDVYKADYWLFGIFTEALAEKARGCHPRPKVEGKK